ncbi:LysM peptidoglycan-binding domain-containing protein [Allosaccharopolyspora coralli]|uniref:LysM peptidoglycan-binding domain-containing protein n=1 Tax=Allosaccharopolyspora coralli TaxID=2665642 RepID=A0A5Q3Q7P2_9PSEU|nr:LysM peptidoglycan-binding domain-containing protein [Allosaccharopolyspora coralli]
MWLVAVAACTFLVVVVAGFVGISGGAVALPSPTTVVQVEPGDTLWGLANRHAPHADTAAVVRRMVEMNGLEGSVARPGESLIVPSA